MQAELEWYFCCADAAAGLKSLPLEPRETSSTLVLREMTDARLWAAMRSSRVAAALAGCSPVGRRVLRAWCGPSSYLTQAQMRSLAPHGRLGPVLALTGALEAWAEAELAGDQNRMRGPVRALEVLTARAGAGARAARGAAAGLGSAPRALSAVRTEGDLLLACGAREYRAAWGAGGRRGAGGGAASGAGRGE